MAEQQLSAPARAEDGVPASPRAGVVHIRYRHTERFTVVGNHLAQHEDLSLTAIGLAVHIQSRPDGAIVSIKALAARFPEGEVAVARALHELEAAGYLSRVRERLPSGKRVTRTYAYDCPERLTEQQSPRPSVDTPQPVPVRTAEPAPVPVPAPDVGAHEGDGEAAELLASLRGQDPRLLLSRRDIARLAPAAASWLERGVTPEAAARTLAADLPREPIRSPYAVLSYRLTHWLPPALPAPRRAPEAPRPYPFQTCESCDLAFRGPEPGVCRDCSSELAEPAVAA